MTDTQENQVDVYEESMKAQKYHELLQSNLSNKSLFKDTIFTEEQHREYFLQKLPNMKVEWKRPSEITEKPYFIYEDASCFDASQGQLNNCWFISAASSLTLRKTLFKRVVPEQSFETNYAGIFHFNFCCNGEWMSVVIDDLLPTVGGRLIFGHSSTRNEYWLALLEKAYAKLNGSYEALSYGSACEAFVDFTGGVPEVIKLNEYDRNNPQHMYDIMYGYFLRNSLMCTYIEKHGSKEAKLPNGLIVMHEYGVITMNRIRYNGKLVNLVRLRNPWGKTVQWNGAWSSNSAEWKSIPEKIRQKADLKLEDVGEFWMDFADFVENFTTIECCHILHGSEKHDWIPFHFNSEWDAKNCGGCINHKDTFPMNPKFLLTVSKKDVDIDDDLCTVLISLTQLSYRYRKMRFKNIIRIGFIIYFYENLTEQETNDGKPDVKDVGPNFVNHEFFHHNLSVAHCDFVDKRNNGLRLRFPPAKYIIVPSTFDPGQVWPFMLRILVSRSKEDRKEYERENKAKDIDLEEINRQLHRHQHQHKEDSGGHHDANHGQTDGNINHGHDDGKKQHSKPPKHSAHDGKNDGAQKSMRRSVRRPPVKIAQQQQQQHQDHDGGATPPKHN